MRHAETVRPVLMFDLGRVLVRLDSGTYLETLRAGSRLDPETFEERLSRFNLNEYRQFETGRMDEKTFYHRMKELFLIEGCTEERLRNAWNSILLPDPVMLAFAERLAETGKLELVLLSNTNPSHFRFCRETMPALSVFARHVLSCDAGYMKPEPEIYRYAKRGIREGTPVLFTDDLPENIAGAEREGIPGVVFRGYGDFIDTVRHHPVFGEPVLEAAHGLREDTANE